MAVELSVAVRPGEVRARGVSRRFRIFHERNATLKETLMRGRRSRHTDLWALRGVNIEAAPGESLGIVGENGSGKSTLLKLLAGIIPPHEGTVGVGGGVASMLELGAGFHPDFTGRENVYMNAAIQGSPAARSTRAWNDHRVLGARVVHRQPGAHLFVGHVHAARVRGRLARRLRRAPAGRGAHDRRRGLPAQVPAAHLRVPAGRRDHALRLPRRRSGQARLRPGHAARARRDSGRREAGNVLATYGAGLARAQSARPRGARGRPDEWGAGAWPSPPSA